MNQMQQKMNDNYIKRYNRISHWFLQKPWRLSLLTIFYKYVPFIVAASYLYLIIYCVMSKQTYVTLKVIFVPLTAFLLVTILRKVFNHPRPYTKLAIKPLIHKDKIGESFPSRHTLSVTIIAMAWLYVNPAVGIILWILTMVIALTRVLSGVHFLKDVLAAIVISILFGWIGFFII